MQWIISPKGPSQARIRTLQGRIKVLPQIRKWLKEEIKISISHATFNSNLLDINKDHNHQCKAACRLIELPAPMRMQRYIPRGRIDPAWRIMQMDKQSVSSHYTLLTLWFDKTVSVNQIS